MKSLSAGGDTANAGKTTEKEEKIVVIWGETQRLALSTLYPLLQQNDSFSGLIRLKTPAGTCSELHLLLRRWAGGSSSHWCKTEKEASHCAHICKIRWRCSIYAEVNGDYDYLRGEILCGVEVWGSGVGVGVPHCVITQLKCHQMHLKECCLAAPWTWARARRGTHGDECRKVQRRYCTNL